MEETKVDVMSGFDVLNTLGGGTVTDIADWVVLVKVLLFLTALIALLLAHIIEDVPTGIVGAVALLVLIFFAISGVGETEVPEPVRYEITVKDGHVIDASRWNIVEQRGQIYVIEERKVSE